MVHFHLPHHHHHDKPKDSSSSISSDSTRSLKHTSTVSSQTSTISSTSSSGSSSLKHVVRKPHSHTLFEFKEPTTPEELCETALKLLYTVPGPSCDELRERYIPRLFHTAYLHKVNCRELTLDGLLDIIKFIRTKWKHSHLRIRSVLMDQDGTATMQAAAVALTFDIIAVSHHDHSHEHEEKRTTAMAVIKIWNGKIAQCDEVLDTAPMKQSATELSCSIM